MRLQDHVGRGAPDRLGDGSRPIRFLTIDRHAATDGRIPNVRHADEWASAMGQLRALDAAMEPGEAGARAERCGPPNVASWAGHSWRSSAQAAVEQYILRAGQRRTRP